ncbi:MAG: aminomethyl-transferring glycine dehydrogenase subunit GcvPA [Haloarculaceae archaeon]
MTGSDTHGSPYTPHTPDDVDAMLDAVGVASEQELFDIPDAVRYDDEFGIESRSEQEIRREVATTLDANDDLVEFLGRGHYAHYVPSMVEELSVRSEFMTSYTQYQPEIAQGFLQALFEYQSMLSELTGLGVVNCSLYDAATALGEAATLSQRVRATSGDRVLVPELLRRGKRETLANYADGPGIVVDTYPMDDGNVDVEGLRAAVDDDVSMIYAENPTVRGTIEERAAAVGEIADNNDALFVLGSDPVALSLLERPADVGADVVVGESAMLGLGTAYGMDTGIFATREDYLRQVPGRLVGASEDENGDRAYTLTLQTREQHIRRERATSNICTNQAWLALRTAMHVASLGADGMADLAKRCVRLPTELAERVDDLDGIDAPVHDRHHFREFVARTDRSAHAVAADLEDRGLAIHALDDDLVQLCVTDVNEHATDDLVSALAEVVA